MNFSAHLFLLQSQQSQQWQWETHHCHWLLGNASLTLALKKRESLLESKLQASSEKISSLQGTVSLLNMCLGEENQGRLKTDKELQILDKDLKKTDERK